MVYSRHYSVFFEKRKVHFDQLFLRLSCQQLLLTMIQAALLSAVCLAGVEIKDCVKSLNNQLII